MTQPQSPFLPSSVYLSDDQEQRIITTNLLFNQIVKAVNFREISSYERIELFNGQQWFSNTPNVKRSGYRRVYQVPVILAGATANILHGITITLAPAPNPTAFTRVYGTVLTAVPDFRPLPRISATLVTDQISLDIVGPNIVIVNGATAPNITSGFIVLEYLQN